MLSVNDIKGLIEKEKVKAVRLAEMMVQISQEIEKFTEGSERDELVKTIGRMVNERCNYGRYSIDTIELIEKINAQPPSEGEDDRDQHHSESGSNQDRNKPQQALQEKAPDQPPSPSDDPDGHLSISGTNQEQSEPEQVLPEESPDQPLSQFKNSLFLFRAFTCYLPNHPEFDGIEDYHENLEVLEEESSEDEESEDGEDGDSNSLPNSQSNEEQANNESEQGVQIKVEEEEERESSDPYVLERFQNILAYINNSVKIEGNPISHDHELNESNQKELEKFLKERPNFNLDAMINNFNAAAKETGFGMMIPSTSGTGSSEREI